MNLNTAVIATPNTKGQIVIPKRFREELGIDQHVPLHISLKGYGVYITPLEKSLQSTDSRQITLEILKKTAGSWAGDDWPQTETRQRKIELKAAKERKSAW